MEIKEHYLQVTHIPDKQKGVNKTLNDALSRALGRIKVPEGYKLNYRMLNGSSVFNTEYVYTPDNYLATIITVLHIAYWYEKG